MVVSFPALQAFLMSLWNHEEGQGLAEYGLILALVSVVAIAALTGLGGAIVNTLGSVTSQL